MNRFALLPIAFFATACADSEGFEDTQFDDQTEVRDLIDAADPDTARSHAEQKAAQGMLVRRAVAMFGKEVRSQGCQVAGAAFAHWEDNRYQYRGLMLNMNAKPYAAIEGRLTHEGSRHGELNGYSTKSSQETGRLTIEGDWLRGSIYADVFSTEFKPGVPMLSMIGGKKINTNDGTGRFIALLADCS